MQEKMKWTELQPPVKNTSSLTASSFSFIFQAHCFTPSVFTCICNQCYGIFRLEGGVLFIFHPLPPPPPRRHSFLILQTNAHTFAHYFVNTSSAIHSCFFHISAETQRKTWLSHKFSITKSIWCIAGSERKDASNCKRLCDSSSSCCFYSKHSNK